MEKSFFNNEKVKKELANFILNTDRFSMGEQCAKFEESFSQWQQRNHSVFVSSGSMANLILIQALLNMGRLKQGDSVGFSALTWPTNVMPLIQLGLRPVPIDCELETLNVSSALFLETLKKEKLKALFITNALGLSSDINVISDICRSENIILLEDNCESLGSVVETVKLGNFGLASTFSTFIGHHMSTIEGGMICTDDEELHAHLVICRAHGWDRNLPSEKQKDLRNSNAVDTFHAMYSFYELSFNGRPTEIQGFLGNCQINFLDEMIELRQRNFQLFNEAAAEIGVVKIKTDHMNTVSNFSMPLVFREKKDFEHYKNMFFSNDIEIRPIIGGNMLSQPFYKKNITESFLLKNTDHIHSNGFYFSNRPDLTEEEIKKDHNLIKYAAWLNIVSTTLLQFIISKN